MPPVWKSEESEATVYEDVERHSEGMISFTYRPPSPADLEALKNTETYRSVVKERDEISGAEAPAEHNGNQTPA